MGKQKLAKWAEMETFNNVIQPDTACMSWNDHAVKGKWRTEIFHNQNPLILELGCGKGEYTIAMSETFPDNNYIGIDIKGARMWRGAKTAQEKALSNVAFLRIRIEFLSTFFADDEVDEIRIPFPDPHPGRSNSNKRLSSPWFLNVYRNLLKKNGIIHLKTDNAELYNYTLSLARNNSLEILFSTEDLYSGKLPFEILSVKTHYEDIFLKEGSRISYISLRLDKNRLIEDGAFRKNL